MSKRNMKPYPGDRVRTPYSDKTFGTVTTVKLSEAGNLVCFVEFDRPCGPGPDSKAWFDSRDLVRGAIPEGLDNPYLQNRVERAVRILVGLDDRLDNTTSN